MEAAICEKMSGAPLPSAKKVSPATFSLMLHSRLITCGSGEEAGRETEGEEGVGEGTGRGGGGEGGWGVGGLGVWGFRVSGLGFTV